MQTRNLLTDVGGRLIAEGLKGNCSVTAVDLVSCGVLFVCLVLLTCAVQNGIVGISDAVKREMNHRESRNPLTPEQAKVVSVAASGMRTAAAITKSDFSREILTKQADVLESIEFGGLSEEDRRAVSFAVKYMRGNSIAGNIMDVIRRLEKVASGGPHDAST